MTRNITARLVIGAILLTLMIVFTMDDETTHQGQIRAGVTEKTVVRIKDIQIIPTETVLESIPETTNPQEEIIETIVDEPVYEAVEEAPEAVEEPVEEVPKAVEEQVEEIPKAAVLNRRDGVNYFNGQKETYYNLKMGGVIRLLDEMGIEHGEYWTRDDGVKMLGDYIMLATDTRRWPKGTILETSLGTGLVVDHCSGSESYSGLWIDVAVTW